MDHGGTHTLSAGCHYLTRLEGLEVSRKVLFIVPGGDHVIEDCSNRAIVERIPGRHDACETRAIHGYRAFKAKQQHANQVAAAHGLRKQVRRVAGKRWKGSNDASAVFLMARGAVGRVCTSAEIGAHGFHLRRGLAECHRRASGEQNRWDKDSNSKQHRTVGDPTAALQHREDLINHLFKRHRCLSPCPGMPGMPTCSYDSTSAADECGAVRKIQGT